MYDVIMKSAVVSEFTANRRLQWMVLGIALLLILSASKSAFDWLEESRDEAMRTHAMIEKMVDAASKPVPEPLLLETKMRLADIQQKIPTVSAQSIAEAEALSAAKRITDVTIARPRRSIVGTESLTFSGVDYWQVRIKIDGGLHELNLMKLLEFFEKTNPHIRLHSMDFQPDAKGVVSLVVDYLYRKEAV